MFHSLRWKLIKWLWPKKNASSGRCANRYWWITKHGPFEVTLTVRDTEHPDAYSREELLKMLETVRKHEAIQGWRVPDPGTPRKMWAWASQTERLRASTAERAVLCATCKSPRGEHPSPNELGPGADCPSFEPVAGS